MPKPIFDSLLERFATQDPGADEKFRLTTVQTDLLISHILIIALTLMDFHKCPVNSLADDLGLNVSKTKDYFKTVGCKIKLAERIAVAELTVPLEFPVRRTRMK